MEERRPDKFEKSLIIIDDVRYAVIEFIINFSDDNMKEI